MLIYSYIFVKLQFQDRLFYLNFLLVLGEMKRCLMGCLCNSLDHLVCEIFHCQMLRIGNKKFCIWLSELGRNARRKDSYLIGKISIWHRYTLHPYENTD
jgi:hypothetical protein